VSKIRAILASWKGDKQAKKSTVEKETFIVKRKKLLFQVTVGLWRDGREQLRRESLIPWSYPFLGSVLSNGEGKSVGANFGSALKSIYMGRVINHPCVGPCWRVFLNPKLRVLFTYGKSPVWGPLSFPLISACVLTLTSSFSCYDKMSHVLNSVSSFVAMETIDLFVFNF
jgi:hypothetical protein